MSDAQTLGRYTLLGELGRGAMGVVYRAEDAMLNRTVAIKTINIAADPEERADYERRFYQEARAAGGLSHPNIVTIYDIGRAGDVVYMAMEFVAGSELGSLLASRLVAPQDAIELCAQVADGLAYAHERGVIHRDVKPANIMVARGGPAKIMDFGIARMRSSEVKTQTGMLLGSPKYMAPEQLLGASVDHRCDLFALGVVIYEATVGTAPFAGDDITQIMYQIVNAAPPAPSAVSARLPTMLDFVLARALAKDPAGRYQDARELAADLRACSAEMAAAAPPAGDDEDTTQTLPLGAFSLPGAGGARVRTAPPAAVPPPAGPPPRPDPGPRLAISRRFDSTAALQRLAAAGAGEAIEQTVRLDRAALAAAASEPPPAVAHKRTVALRPAPRAARRGWIVWAAVAVAALVAALIAFG